MPSTVWAERTRLIGGAGADKFIYTAVSESTGTDGSVTYDHVTDFDAMQDHFDFPVSVTGINTKVTSGNLTLASFNENLASDIGASQLGGPSCGAFHRHHRRRGADRPHLPDRRCQRYRRLSGRPGLCHQDVTGIQHATSLAPGNFI